MKLYHVTLGIVLSIAATSFAVTETDHGSEGLDGTYSATGVTYGLAGVSGSASGFDGAEGEMAIGGQALGAPWTLEAIFSTGDNAANQSQALIGDADVAIKAEQWQDTGMLGFSEFGVADHTYSAATPAVLTHVTFVGQSAGVDLYVGGAFVETIAAAFSLPRGGVASVPLLGDHMLGVVDELAIYDYALSANAIGENAASLAGGEPTVHAAIGAGSPVNWYQFNAVPEPSCCILLLAGLGLAGLRVRRK